MLSCQLVFNINQSIRHCGTRDDLAAAGLGQNVLLHKPNHLKGGKRIHSFIFSKCFILVKVMTSLKET